MTSVVPLDSAKHSKVKINSGDFSVFNSDHMVPLTAFEMTQAANDMPVVFVKGPEEDQFVLVGILGLEPKENLFVTQDGKWRGMYIPQSMTAYPFRLVPAGEDGSQVSLALLESSPHVSETDGEALFDGEGKQTDYLRNRVEALHKYFDMLQATPLLIKELVELDLLVHQTLTLTLDGQEKKLDGIFIVDEKKLNALTDEQFLTLRKKNILPMIYSHMGSVGMLRNLVRMKAENLG